MAGSNFSIVNGVDGTSKVSISTPANDVNGNTVVGHLAMTPVAGVATPVGPANPLPVSDPGLGASTDTPWGGGGGASAIAALKAIYLKLAATLPVSLTGSLPAGTSAIGSVSVSNFPATQPVSLSGSLPAGTSAIGSVSVSNFPATQPVSLTGSLPIGTNAIGSVVVSNLPATQPVSLSGALPAGTNPIGSVSVANFPGTQPVSLSGALPTGTNAIGSVSVSNLPATQPVSAVALPLPLGAATASKQPAIGAAGNPAADVLTVQGAPSMTALKIDGSAVTQPVSGTVSIANAPVSWRFSSAAEASRAFKTSAGTLYSIYVTASSAGFLMVFDATTAPADGPVTPVDVIQCASNATTVLDYTATPLPFVNGLVAVFSSTGPFVKTANPVAFLKGGYV